jgi:hypothetical protein
VADGGKNSNLKSRHFLVEEIEKFAREFILLRAKPLQMLLYSVIYRTRSGIR